MIDNVLKLIRPRLDWENEFSSMLQEYRDAGDDWFAYESHIQERGFASYVEWLQNGERGVVEDNAESDLVPWTTLWLTRGHSILGVSSIRHVLTPYLLLQGGNIGYTIRPSQRRQGFGTFILSATLGEAKLLNLDEVLLVCEKENVASARIIEKNGGQREDEAPDERLTLLRYWIDLRTPSVSDGLE